MALDSKYILATASLQMLFRDKDTGLPLRAGVINFFADQSRTTPKLIYKLSGSPPYSDTSYVAIGSQITLTEAGTFSDNNGNDIVPYYYPYDDSNNIELYYVVVTSATGVPQFTREAIPNLTIEDANVNGIVNYVPNGQFLAHNNLTDPDNFVTQEVTTLGQGGWSFVTVPASAETYKITFDRIGSAEANLTANPRYKVHLIHESAGTDAKKDLRLKFKNVNRFASDIQDYTYFFTGKSANGNSLSIDLYLIKNFGTGGGASSPTETYVSTVVLPANTESPQNINFLFGLNNSSTLGSNDDDYVELALRPQGTGWNYEVTDFGLTPDNKVITVYPETTNAEMLSQAVAGWMSTPAYDSSDLYLPLVLTQAGMVFDHSHIGEITSDIYTSAYSSSNNFPRLFCDGSSYIYANYSSLGIPYSRLGNVFISNSPVANIPMYGTGANFITTYATAGNTAVIRLTSNTAGALTAASDGNTGWTIAGIHTGAATIATTAYSNIANTILVALDVAAPALAAAPTAGTSGFTITVNDIYTGITAQEYYSFTVLTTVATALSAKYFTFSSGTTAYYVWFKVDGVGADPAPGGTGIEVDLLSTYTAQDVANCVREAINMYQMSTVVVGGLPVAGHYWLFSANPASVINYYVWYKVAGAGTDPAVTSRTGIMVTLTGTENAAAVALATLRELNKYQYAIPDLRGMFLRGLDAAGTWDFDVAQRWSMVSALSGANLGTFEFNQFLSHLHVGRAHIAQLNGPGTSISHFSSDNDDPTAMTRVTGGSETRPVNAAVNWFIKY